MPTPRSLTIVQIQPLAASLARRIARRPDDVDDLIQVGLIAYHKNHHGPRRAPRKPYASEANRWSDARTTLQRAMFRYYRKAEERLQFVPLDLQSARVFADDRLRADLLELDEFFDALEHACGAAARRLAENLVAPDGACAARVLLEVRRKRRIQSVGHDPGNPRVRFSQRLIRDALGLTRCEWTRELGRVRAFTREWLVR